MKSVSIYVPCYNEEGCLEKNIRTLNSYMKGSIFNDYTIVIVDDCSTDGTSSIAVRLSIELPNVSAIRFIGKKPTRRENLMKAMKANTFSDYVIFLDCDLSTSLTGIEELLSRTYRGGISIGNRYDKYSIIKRSLKRFVISKCLNFWTRILFGTRVKDHFIGFKCFHKDDLFRILSNMNPGERPLRSMWADAEMIIWARKLGINVQSIPVTWKESRFTKLNYRREFGILLYSVWFRWKYGPAK